MLRPLTREEKLLVRRLGAQLYRQQNRNEVEQSVGVVSTAPTVSQQGGANTTHEAPEPESQPEISPPAMRGQEQEQHHAEANPSTSSPTQSFIMVASTPEPEENQENLVPRAASPRKRPRRATIASP